MDNLPKEVVVIGGGQSGLATAYYLKRNKIDFVVLDASEQPGGAWQDMWDSLSLFSAAEHNALPGWWMPPSENEYPSKDEVIDYLKAYEKRYDIPVERPVNVEAIYSNEQEFEIKTDRGIWKSLAVVSATGTWNEPYIPDIPGKNVFTGKQLHAKDYKNPDGFKGKTVVIVGAGNSGAQILAEVSKVTETIWANREEPSFLPDHVDGRYLFDFASKKYKGKEDKPNYSVGDIVMVPPVKDARERGVLNSVPMFEKIDQNSILWSDGSSKEVDVIIWCTGFKPYLKHLTPLNVVSENNRVETSGTKAVDQPGLWLVGYGGWTGYASATIIGVGRTARSTVNQIKEFLKEK